MRLLNQFLRFELSAVFATPEFTNAIVKVVNQCLREQCKLKGGTIVNGLLLDSEKAYVKEEWAGINLLIFSNSLNRYLLPTEYLILEYGGFQLLIGDQPTVDDNYVVFFTTSDLLATHTLGSLFTTDGDLLYTTDGEELAPTQSEFILPAGQSVGTTEGSILYTTEGQSITTT